MPTGGLIAGIGDFGVEALVTQAEQAKSSAESSASTATTKASQASASATTATTQAGIATTKADEASASATTATTQAGIATAKAGESSISAGIATTKANEAQVSATNAQSSANSASASAQLVGNVVNRELQILPVKAGSAMNIGTPVYISSADGTNIIVSPASSATEATSSKVVGLLMQTLANNGLGSVVTGGKLAGLNTSTATLGDAVWLGSTAGTLIYGLANKPKAPQHLVSLGVVSRVHATNGEITVRVQNGFEFDEIHNYLESNLQDGDVVQYDYTSGLYKNSTTLRVVDTQIGNDVLSALIKDFSLHTTQGDSQIYAENIPFVVAGILKTVRVKAQIGATISVKVYNIVGTTATLEYTYADFVTTATTHTQTLSGSYVVQVGRIIAYTCSTGAYYYNKGTNSGYSINAQSVASTNPFGFAIDYTFNTNVSNTTILKRIGTLEGQVSPIGAMIDNSYPVSFTGLNSRGDNQIYANQIPITKRGVLKSVRVKGNVGDVVIIYAYNIVSLGGSSIKSTMLKQYASYTLTATEQVLTYTDDYVIQQGSYLAIKTTGVYFKAGGGANFSISSNTTSTLTLAFDFIISAFPESNSILDAIDYLKSTSKLFASRFGQAQIGCTDYQEFDTDYNHIIFYGQSLSMGTDAKIAITTQQVADTLMIGDRVWISKGNNNALSLSPLVASTYSTTVGESPAVSCTHAFKTLFDRYHRRGKQVKFIATNCGEGGMSVEKLSKESTNGTNYYTTEFLLAINRAKSIVNGLGKTIGCSAIVYMQGESNYDGVGLGLTSGTDATFDKATYKALLTTLKNNMQSDIMTTYEQTSKPLFFIYQTSGYYITRESMSVNLAQNEFANENTDVILLNTVYQTPDYGNQHLTANGYRWYGESIAKSFYNTFIEGKKESVITAKQATIINSKLIKIDFSVPCPPLQLDTYTLALQTNFGFKVLSNGSEVVISNVEIVGDSVLITLVSSLTNGSVDVKYAGFGRNGSGNLKDSDSFVSKYNYYDDSALSSQPSYNPKDSNGTNLYGKKYPLYNFANHFTLTISY